MNRLQCLIRLARALDYNRDPDPKHWKTINGAKVHLDKNGNYDGGAGGKFNGNHHYGGPDWKQKTALMNQLTNALRGGVTQKQAQGSQAGNTSAQNVASKATQSGGGNGTIKTEQEYEIEISNIKQDYDKVLHDPNATIADKQAAFAKVKAACVEAAQNGHVIVGKHLQNSVATPEQIDEIKTHLKNAPMEIRALWNTYGSDIEQDLDRTLTQKTYNHYDNEGMVHLELAKCNSAPNDKPYRTFFHENGHAISAYLETNQPCPGYDVSLYATNYNNGEFPKAIESDAKKMIDDTAKEIKEKIKQGDYKWLDNHNLISITDRIDYGKLNPQTGKWVATQMPPGYKYKKEFAYKYLTQKMRDLVRVNGNAACIDLGDMFSGVTNNRVCVGGYHETRYWRDSRKWYLYWYGKDINHGLAEEAFAEFLSAKVVNPESLNLLKKFLPTASDCFDRMMKDAIK